MNAEPNDYPNHTNNPPSIPALLIYADETLSPALGYVLSLDTNNTWQLSAHPVDELPNLTRASEAQPLTVECGADLRSAEPGATTTVQTTELATETEQP